MTLICLLQGFYVFIRALQLLRAHNQGVVLVGLGGASGSGKTAFSAKVGVSIRAGAMHNLQLLRSGCGELQLLGKGS